MPTVSVILPVFNAVSTIERAVRSILDQTLRDLELIVVDDGSSDGTKEVLAQIVDSRLRIESHSHRGVAVATNVGTSIASAPLIARMDADDLAHPTKLEKQLKWLRSTCCDVVGCQVRIIDDAGGSANSLKRYERWINEETIDREQIMALRFVEFPLVNPTILARREYFEIGFADNDCPEDYELMLVAASRALRFDKVNEVLFDWIDHPLRATRRDSRYSAESFDRCRRRHLLRGPLATARQVDLWGVGRTGKPWLRWIQDHQIDVRTAYDVNERKVGEWIHGVPIRHPDELPQADGTPLLIAVGANDARAVIRPKIHDRGYVSGRDAWFVA